MSTGCKAFDTIWGKLRERKVTSGTQERVVYIVVGFFFLMQFDIGEDSAI